MGGGGTAVSRPEVVTGCRQCGGWITVTMLRLGRRRVRYWCQRCRAVVAARQPVPLRPVAQVRAQTDDAGERRDGGQPLDEVMPPAMVRWLASRPGRPVTVDRLDKAQLYQLYRQWDAHLARLGPGGAAGLAAAGEDPPVPDLPAFSAVVGALHEACYDTGRVVDVLAPQADATMRTAVHERAEHARRWLARHRQSQCWIEQQCPPDGPARPDPQQVEAAIATLRAGELPAKAVADAARAAAFGTTGGPSLARLLQFYPAEQVAAALQCYLDTGGRPLREQVLARLTRAPSGPDPVTG